MSSKIKIVPFLKAQTEYKAEHNNSNSLYTNNISLFKNINNIVKSKKRKRKKYKISYLYNKKLIKLDQISMI